MHGNSLPANAYKRSRLRVAAKSPNAGRLLRRYLLLFVVFSGALVWAQRPDLFPWIGSCNASGYDSEHYLAYCNAYRYGDYEYYAMWHGTESGAVERLKSAEVLFLGNSRALFGFSTEPVRRFFEQSAIPHYVMGFGLGSKSEMARLLMQRHELNPAALVINVDPFFSSERNSTLRSLIADEPLLHWQHWMKRQQQSLQREVCAVSGRLSWLRGMLCAGEETTLYRNVRNGHWNSDFFVNEDRFPVDRSVRDLPKNRLDEAASVAERFIVESGVPRECLVFTATPHDRNPNALAIALGERLNVPVALPTTRQLQTFDQSHLSASSAERWSRELLDMIGSRLRDCVRPTAGT